MMSFQFVLVSLFFFEVFAIFDDFSSDNILISANNKLLILWLYLRSLVWLLDPALDVNRDYDFGQYH